MLKTFEAAVAAAALLSALPLAFTARQADAGQRWAAGRRDAWTGAASSYTTAVHASAAAGDRQ